MSLRENRKVFFGIEVANEENEVLRDIVFDARAIEPLAVYLHPEFVTTQPQTAILFSHTILIMIPVSLGRIAVIQLDFYDLALSVFHKAHYLNLTDPVQLHSGLFPEKVDERPLGITVAIEQLWRNTNSNELFSGGGFHHLTRQRKDKQTARYQYPDKFLNVLLTIARLHVLQDDVGVNEVEIIVGKQAKITLRIEIVVTALAVSS